MGLFERPRVWSFDGLNLFLQSFDTCTTRFCSYLTYYGRVLREVEPKEVFSWKIRHINGVFLIKIEKNSINYLPIDQGWREFFNGR